MSPLAIKPVGNAITNAISHCLGHSWNVANARLLSRVNITRDILPDMISDIKNEKATRSSDIDLIEYPPS